MSNNDTDEFKVSSETQKAWDDQKMRDQIGITVRVVRDEEGGDGVRRANRALNEIGDYMKQNVPALADLTYCGSAAVHIYLAPSLGQVVYISQTQPLLETEERVAGPAFTDLQKSMMQHYGRRTTRIRSGF